MEDKTGVNISNVGGDVIGTNVSGTSNIIGKDINVDISGTVSINSQILNKLPQEYSNAFKEFTEKINEQIKKNNIKIQQVEPIKESINELAEETETIRPNEEPSIIKQQSWKEKLFRVLKNVFQFFQKQQKL